MFVSAPATNQSRGSSTRSRATRNGARSAAVAHQPALNDEIGQRVVHRHHEQRHEHAEPILLPEERSPSVANSPGSARWSRRPATREGAKAHRRGGRAHEHDNRDPGIDTICAECRRHLSRPVGRRSIRTASGEAQRPLMSALAFSGVVSGQHPWATGGWVYIQFNVPLRYADARAIMEGPAGTRRSERYRSGRNGGASKASCRVTGTWVRIPPSPPVFRPLSSFFVRFRRWSFVDRNEDESDFLSAFSRFPIAGWP